MGALVKKERTGGTKMDNFVNQMAGIATVGVAAGVTLKVTDAALGVTKKATKKSSKKAHTPKKHQETLARVRAHDAKMRKAVFGK